MLPLPQWGLGRCSLKKKNCPSFSWLLVTVYHMDLGFQHLQRGLVLVGWCIAKSLFCTIRHVQANKPPSEEPDTYTKLRLGRQTLVCPRVRLLA